MQFIEPLLLWGALAVVIPIVIHLWHQKQGKPLPWAATQWLIERDQQQSRGLRLDNVLLLIIRCLLLILLAILLSQPIVDWLAKPKTIEKVHLVQPNAFIANNFRFELDEAQKKGEKVVWANEQLKPFGDNPTEAARTADYNPLTLQTAINRLSTNTTELHLYLVNDYALTDVPVITVPTRFRLHIIVDSTNQPRAYLAVKSNKKLYINRSGKLTSSPSLDPGLKFRSAPTRLGSIPVLLSYQKPQERQTVKAALAALTDVYGLDLSIDETPVPNRVYDWVLTDQTPPKPARQTLYLVSAVEQPITAPNVVFTNQTLTPQASERVANGQLPEWLGEQLCRHFGLEIAQPPLSKQALQALFLPVSDHNKTQQAGVQNALLLVFVILLAIERWLALIKNA
jgi:hypothetical protein